MGFSTINHPFWGSPIYGNPHINEGIQQLDDILIYYEYLWFFIQDEVYYSKENECARSGIWRLGEMGVPRSLDL